MYEAVRGLSTDILLLSGNRKRTGRACATTMMQRGRMCNARPATGLVSHLRIVVLLALSAIAAVLLFWINYRTPLQPMTVADRRVFVAADIAAAALTLAASLVTAATIWSRWSAPPRRVAWFGSQAGNAPLWLLVLPVAGEATYVSARMALHPDPNVSYGPSFWLWFAALVAFAGSFAEGVHKPGISFGRPSWQQALEWSFVIGITGAALALRVAHVETMPPLVHVDEEAIGFDALQTIDGRISNMFAVSWGANPTMGFFVYGLALRVFGTDIEGARIGSALFGVAAIPLLYLVLREMYGRGPAAVGAVLLTGYDLHLIYSRVAVNVIWDTPAMLLAVFFAYRGSVRGRSFDFAAAGLVSGLALYLYHGTRIVPVVVVAYLAMLCLARWRFARMNAGNLAVFAASFALAALPIAAFFLTHQHAFWARVEDAGIFQSGYVDQQRALGQSVLDVLWDQTYHAFGGWIRYPDRSPFIFYSPSRPLMDGWLAVALVVGVIYALVHIDDRRSAMLLMAFVLPTFVGGALTLGPPNAQRLFGALAAAIALASIGIWQVAAHLLWWRRSLVWPVALGVAAILAIAHARLYFDAAEGNSRWGGSVQRVTVDYVTALPPDTRVYWYGSPLVTANQSPLSLHEHPLIEVFDRPVSPVTRPSRAVFLFMNHRRAQMTPVVEACPGGRVRTLSWQGSEFLYVYEITEARVCEPQPVYADNFERALLLDQNPAFDYTMAGTASLEPTEPQPCVPVSSTVWYRYEAQQSGALHIDTAGSGYDTVVALYTGSSVDSLARVACNDDDETASDGRSILDFVPMDAGVTYYIQVGSAEKSALGPGLLSLRLWRQ